jgi:hypothetical protein
MTFMTWTLKGHQGSRKKFNMPSAKMLNVGAKTVLGENLLSKKTVEQTPWAGGGSG